MYPYLGKVRPGSTVFIPFHTFDSNDPSASVTITGLATTDIEVYKDASMTQRASDSGYALVDTDGIDIDTTTGVHGVTIDLSDNTTAGFWAAGSDYVVVIASITVDAATVNFIPIRFSIGYPNSLYDTTIATLSTQTSFTLTNGPAEDDALNGMWCVVHDVASSVQIGHALISDYTGSTKTVTLAAATTFTIAASDNISIMGIAPLQPTTLGNTLDVTATGAAGIDWGNIENKTTANDLSGTDIQLCDTVTTNTDMRGTDSALLASSAPTNFGDLAITVTTGQVTVGTSNDKTGYSISGTKTTLDALNDVSAADVNAQCDTALSDIGLDHLISSALPTSWAVDVASGSVFDNIADDGTASYDRTTDSLQAIRDRGDTSWITGGGGGITDILNIQPIIPNDIDLANTATVRLGFMLTNAVDDLPSTAEITPGTIDIERKAIGGTSWTSVVSAAACSESAGQIYYDEVFDSGTGYAEGDSIRITFKSQKITVAANDYEITDATGVMFQTSIRQTMRGTDSAALASDYTSARAGYLDNINGHTAQTGDTYALANGANGFANIKTDTAATLVDTNELQGDWTNGGRLDLIIDAIKAVTDNLPDSGALTTIDTNVDSILTDTGTTIPAQITALNDISAADVNAQVLDVLNTDTFAELSSIPAASTTLTNMIRLLYSLARNKTTQTSTTFTLRNDADSGNIGTSTVSDDGTTATKGEMS